MRQLLSNYSGHWFFLKILKNKIIWKNLIIKWKCMNSSKSSPLLLNIGQKKASFKIVKFMGSGVRMVLWVNAVILWKSYPVLLCINPMNWVRSYDEEDCLFQCYKFYGPWSMVLVLGHGFNNYIGKGGVISTDWFFVIKICSIVSLYVMQHFKIFFSSEFRKCIGLNNFKISKIISLVIIKHLKIHGHSHTAVTL